jgi:hypothetical protein
MHHGYLQGPDGTFTTFDPPGSIYTSPTAISPAGAITGFYNDADGVFHGFVRAPNGAIVTLDPPDSASTLVLAVYSRGSYHGSPLLFKQHGPRVRADTISQLRIVSGSESDGAICRCWAPRLLAPAGRRIQPRVLDPFQSIGRQ